MAALERHLPLNEFAYLRDVNDWLDVLLPARHGETSSLTNARLALGRLTPSLSPRTRSEIEQWERRLRGPRELATWLDDRRAALEGLLHTMYAARNLAFHSGMFASAGDVVMSRGSVLVSDMVLEFLGNYYRHVNQTTKTPADIVDELARRYDSLTLQLKKSNAPAYRLNVALLTGPITSGWDR